MANSHQNGNPEPRAQVDDQGNENLDTVELDGDAQPAARTVIDVTPEIHLAIDQAIDALAEHSDVYQRAGSLVTVIRCPGETTARGITLSAGTPVIREIAPAYLWKLLSESAVFYEKNKNTSVQIPPPTNLRDAVHKQGYWPGVRPLTGVVETPVLRADGTLLDKPGYDIQTGLIYEPAAGMPDIPVAPSRQLAQRYVAEIRRMVNQFPWAGEVDGEPGPHFSAWLAALLTPLARRMIAGPTPFFLFDANTPGSGKSILANIISLVIYGRAAPNTTSTTNNEEMRKQITSLAVAGTPLVVVDNIRGAFGTPALDAVTTGTYWSDRILGKNRWYEGPMLAVWIGTGNNPQPQGDLPRRICYARLESQLPDPENREDLRIKDLLGHVYRHRLAILRAALIILRAFIAAERPKPPTELRPWGSYRDWQLIRECLVWVGLPDPAETRAELQERIDKPTDALAVLLDGWTELDTQELGLTSGQIAERLKEDRDRMLSAPLKPIRDALCTLCRTPPGKPLDAHSIGQRLKQYEGRVILVNGQGQRLVSTTRTHGNVKVWTRETVCLG